MTYIDLINRFWELDKVKQLPWIDSKMYFFLLNECNIRRWLNPFELQTRYLAINLGISRKTIGEARNRLKQLGLIDIREARGTGATLYTIRGMPLKQAAPLPYSQPNKPSNTIQQQQRYETTRNTQPLRRRGFDPSANRPEDYTAAL